MIRTPFGEGETPVFISRKIFFSAVSAIAISVLPITLDSSSIVSFAKAHAKGGDKGGGNDKGGGSDKGADRGGGNAGRGKSDDNGKGKGGGAEKSGGKSASAGNLLDTLLSGGKPENRKAKPAVEKGAKSSKKAKSVDVAALDTPGGKPVKEKNLNARLAGLNSLNRNYHAYLSSQSPRMALIRDYVLASANADLAGDALKAAADKAALSQAALDAALAAIEPFDGSAPVADPTADALQARLDELNGMEPPVDPAQLDAFNAEKQALSDALAAADKLATDEQAVADAQAAADAAAVGTTDADLKEALMAAANKNRVAEYGDDYINDQVMDWAKDVLGVGDAYGKIDQVKEALATKTASVEPEPEPVVEPVVEATPAVLPVLLPAN